MLMGCNIRIFIVIAIIMTTFSFDAVAATPEQNLSSVQQKLKQQMQEEQNLKKKAQDANKEVYDTRQLLIDTAKKIQDYEAQISKMEDSFEVLKVNEKHILENIRDKNRQIGQLVAILQGISLRPLESLMLQSADPVDTLRSSFLMRDIVPLINRETEKLKLEIAKLSKVREDIRTQYLKIKTAAESLKEQQVQIDLLLRKKISLQKDLEEKARASSKEVQNLAKKAKDLQELVLEIEQRKKATDEAAAKLAAANAVVKIVPKGAGLDRMKGKLSLPVKGEVVKKFNDTLDSGLVSKGLLIKARDKAQVVAPFDGEVVFAGPFRNYKDMLIISHGNDYYTLLAGMEKNDTHLGQGLLAGEPVGVLSDSNASLYVEIRKKGDPLNPESWFVK